MSTPRTPVEFTERLADGTYTRVGNEVQLAGAAGGLDVNVHDGGGNPLTSTAVGADQALDVNIVAGAGAGGTSMVDDTAFTPGVTAITPAGAMLDDVAPDTVNEGDAGIVRMSANRNLYVNVRDAAGNERGLNVDATGSIAVTDGGGSLTVDDGGLALSVDDAGGSLTVDDGGVNLGVNLHDGGGTALTSTLVGADQAIDVNVVQTVGGAGGTSITDDTAFTPGVTNVTPIGGFADEVAPDSVDEGDAGAVRMSLNRSLYIQLRDAAGNERGANINASNQLETNVNGTLTGITNDVSIDDGGNVISVDDAGGSLTVDGTVTASNAAGDVADDGADSGNPVKIGGVAVETDGTDPTSVSAEGDRAEIRSDRQRRLLVNPYNPYAWITNNNYAAAQTNQQQKAAPGANLSLYVQRFIISADAAVNIRLVDDTAGAPATIAGPYYIGANAGANIVFEPPLRVDANTDIGITSSAAVNHTATITGYTAP